VVNIFGNLFKRKKPKLSKKDQEEFLKRKDYGEIQRQRTSKRVH